MKIAAALLLVLLCACSGQAEAPDRTIEVQMDDTAFDPASIDITKGETVRFVFTNKGELQHDALIGDAAAQKEHGEMMAEGEHQHGDDSLTLKPGESGELTYTFDQAGTLEIGCHEPGHYESGMKIVLSVA